MSKFFKWLAGIFGSNTNTTAVSQTTKVEILKGREPNGDYEYKLRPLSKEELSEISRRAIEDVAKMKIVTEGREERIREWMKEDMERAEKDLERSPDQAQKVAWPSQSVGTSKPRTATRRTRIVSDDDSYRRRSDDVAIINTTSFSDTYHHTSSHSSSHDSYSSCDSSSSSSGSCD